MDYFTRYSLEFLDPQTSQRNGTSRAAKWVPYDAQLESFMQAYDNQEYGVLDYLTVVSAAL
jgi:hypothetical protein